MSATKKEKARIKKKRKGILKERVLAAKERLPEYGLTNLMKAKFPRIDVARLTAVLQLRATDENITVQLEALADLLNVKKQRV